MYPGHLCPGVNGQRAKQRSRVYLHANVTKICDTFSSNRSLDSAMYVYMSLAGRVQGLA